MQDLEELKKYWTRWSEDPVLFCRQVLKLEPLEWQQEAFRLVQTRKRLAIRSGHGVGKSNLLASMALWFLTCRYPARIVATAPTSRQLYDVLWAETAMLAGRMDDFMRSQFAILKDRIELVGAGKESFLTARTARRESPEALQGIHGENVLILLDEASGIPNVVFEAGEGALSTENSMVVMTGNPTRNTGYFHDAFKSEAWAHLVVSCEDSPIVSREYIDYMRKKYGERSNQFRVRVLGEFPEVGDDAIIPMHLIEAAVNRDVEPASVKPVWGLDVARTGKNKTALAKRKGNVLLEPVETWGGYDTMQTVAAVVERYEAQPDELLPSEICIDVIGVGAGVYDRLAQLGLPATPINVAERSVEPERFVNLRAELLFKAAEWFGKRHCRIPDDEELIYQLSDISFTIVKGGQYQAESKADMLKRGSESPDAADAFVLTLANGRDVPDANHKPDPYRAVRKHDTSWMAF